MGPALAGLAALALVVAGCLPAARAASSAQTAQAAGYPVKVFFSRHPASDNDPAAVFAVGRVAPTLGVATYAVGQLVAGPSAAERSAGYYSALHGTLSGTSSCGGPNFRITLDTRGPTPEKGTATLRFCRAVALAGDLSGARIAAEVMATLTQFSNVRRAVILTNSGHCFDDLSGRDACLGLYPVKVFFSRHPASDNDPSAVVAVGRRAPTLGVATFAIGQLVAGPVAAEQRAGDYTPLAGTLHDASNCGGADFAITLDHRGARAEKGTATLRFCRSLALGGELDDGRVTAEVTATLRQFANIARVVILTRDGHCVGDLSGRDACLG